MKKILIISYHYLPDNIIASRRAESYATNLCKYGFSPTILTHKWEVKNGAWAMHERGEKVEYEAFDTHNIIRIPRLKNFIQRVQESFSRIGVLSKILTFLLNTFGYFDMHELYSYANFRSFLFKHLKEQKYDYILAIFSPTYHIRLAYELHNKFNIPYVVDFRDLHDNRIVGDNFSPVFKEKAQLFIIEKWISKWLSKALFVTSVSQVLADKMGSIGKIDAYQITNGFEKELFLNLKREHTNKFCFIHTGTIYKEQNIGLLLNGLNIFLKDKKSDKLLIKFIGLNKKNADIEGFRNKWADFIEITGRIDRKSAIQEMKNAHILFYPAWTTTKGIFSGKIFEYLGCKNNILIAPGNKDVVENLIIETNAGSIANTPEEVASYLEEKYNEWLLTANVKYFGIEEKINQYTREEQVGKMAHLLNNSMVNG